MKRALGGPGSPLEPAFGGRFGLSLAAEAAEAEDRVQLDRVRRDPGLAVGEVEERDSPADSDDSQSRMASSPVV